MAGLHELQAAAYVNTQGAGLLAEPACTDALTPEDRRRPTPLFWTHVAPYGEVKFNWASGWHCALITLTSLRLLQKWATRTSGSVR